MDALPLELRERVEEALAYPDDTVGRTMRPEVAAALSGVAVPLILQRMGIDPALSGAVVPTTVTDVIGFMSFLGLATLFLL